jgi:hypothetical protein
MRELIFEECKNIRDILLNKNAAYGNSAAEPINIFSKAGPLDQINDRLDDKLKRIKYGKEYAGEDAELDIIGYLILKRCVRRYVTNGVTHATDCVSPPQLPETELGDG